MYLGGHRLGIDFGTSSTVAVLAGPDGRHRQLLFGETPVMPSAVCLDPSGALLVGADAVRMSRARPEYFEPNPKARIDDGAILLGDTEIPVAALIAAVLRRVHDEAVRVIGGPVDATVLTHPASWGARRRGLLQQAGTEAGLPAVSLVAEPVAAAAYFVQSLGAAVPTGGSVVVYDLGAGTFDASVVRRTEAGYTVLAEEGIPDAGGLDLDSAIVAYFGAVHGAARPELWQRLTNPQTAQDRRAARTLWDDVRSGKEALSRAATTTVFLPLLDTDAVLGREQLELLSRPLLDRTVNATRNAIRLSGVARPEVTAVFLVGGASRMPLAATLLHQALGFAPSAIEQPQLVVADGCLHVPAAQRATEPVSGGGFPPAAVPMAPVAPVSGDGFPPAAMPVAPVAPVSGGSFPPAAVPVAPAAPVSASPFAIAPVTGTGPVVTPVLAPAPAPAPSITSPPGPRPPVLEPAGGDLSGAGSGSGPSRRRAIVAAAAGVAVVAAAGVAYVVTREDDGDKGADGAPSSGANGDGRGTGGTTGAKTTAVDPPGVKLATKAEVPVGGGLISDDGSIIITQPAAGTFKAFRNVCTHQGCALNDVSEQKMRCPCHGSTFSIADGSVIGGPAKAALAAKPVHVSGEGIWVET